MLGKITKNFDYWITKPLSLVGKFQICSKIPVATHVYYSSCWAPSRASYLKMEHLEIFFGLLVLIIMVSTKLLGTFVASQKSLAALACFPLKNKDFLFVPSGSFMLFLEMKLGRFWFTIAFPLAFLLIDLLGRGLAFIPFSSCVSLLSYRALLLSKASGRPGALASLGWR